MVHLPSSSTAAAVPLRVVLIDDEPLVRLSTRAVLEVSGAFVVVGEAPDGATGVDVVRHQQPHVVLLDLLLAAVDGAALVGPLLRACPTAMVSVFSAMPALRHRERLRSVGAFSYYEKTAVTSLAELLRTDHDAFARALAGEDVLAPAAC